MEIEGQIDDEREGADLDSDLAAMIENLFKAGLLEGKLQDKMAEYPRPGNTPALTNVKVNQVIWDTLSPGMRSQGVKMQKVHNLMTKAMIAGAQSAEEIKSQLTPSLQGAFKKVLDAMVLMLAAMRELAFRRRELIKSGLNTEYAALCTASTPVTNQLFGENLTQQVRDIGEMNRVSRSLQHRGRGGRGQLQQQLWWLRVPW